MGSVSRAGIGAAIGLAFAAAFVVAQDSGVPEKLLGTRDGQYLLFDLQDSLEAELWDELTGSAVPSSGDVLVVDSVAQQGRVTLIAESKQKIVAGGVAGLRQVPDPTSADLGNVVTVVQGATRDAPYTYAWQAPSGGGAATPLSNDDPKNLGTKTPGTSTRASRGDHVHAIPGNMATTAALQRVAATAAAHRQVPAFDTTNNGNLLAVRVVNNVASTDWGLFRDVSDPGVAKNGDVLTVTGSESYGWATPSGGGSGATLSDTPAVATGTTAGAGTATEASRQDHVHPQTGLATSAALTAAVAAVRAVPDPAHVSDGDVLTANGGSYAWAAGGGSSGGGGGEWTVLATASAPRTTSTFSVGTGRDPDWTYAEGHTVASARALLTGDTPPEFAVRMIQGSNLSLAQFGAQATVAGTGHVSMRGVINKLPFQGTTGDAVSAELGVSGTQTIFQTANTAGLWSAATVSLVYRLPGGGGGGKATPLSDGIPKALTSGAGASGVGTAASRGDHEHPASLSDAAPKIAGTAAAGTGTKWSRDDHVHPANLSDANPNHLAVMAAAGEATAASRADHVHSTTGIRQVPSYQNVPSALGYDVNYVLGFSLCESSSPGSNNETCNLSWQKPVRWQRHLVGSSAPTDFSGTGSFTIKESTYALQAFMQNTLTAYQKFEIYLKFTKSGQEFHYLINLAGLPPGEAQATETATYYSENSNNSLTGNTQWARLEVGAATHTVTYHLNSQGESKVEARIYGYR